MKTLIDRVARVAARRAALLEILFVWLVVVLVWLPFLQSQHVDNALSDWSYRTDYVGYGLNALFHDHQFPYWVTDPRFEQYRMKGIHDFFANPETDLLSVITPLAKLWGLFVAVKVSLVLYLGVGVWGCRRLLVAVGGAAGALSLLLASLLGLCNGAIAGHFLAGHVQFLAATTFPLALALELEAFEPALHAAKRCFRACLAGAVLAAAYYSGAVHPLAAFLPGFVVLAPLFAVLIAPRRYRVVLPMAALVGVSFVVLAAFKWLPGVVDFSGYRAAYRGVYEGWRQFGLELVSPWSPTTGSEYHHETNLYVGWVGVGALALALLGARDRRAIPLLLACVVLGWLMFF